MIEVRAKARKWGNSLGIAVPKSVVKKARLRAGQDVKIFLQEKADISSAFGKLKIQQATQALLDDIRQGEE